MKSQIQNGVLLRKIRTDNELSAEDVAGMVGVSSRQISAWESGTQPMPRERLELLIMKLERSGPEGAHVTVRSDDGVSFSDVVSERNFAGFKLWNDGTATIKSVAVNRATGRPFMQTTTFLVERNEHVVRAGMKWQRDLTVGVRSAFEGDPNPVGLAMAAWLSNRVAQVEQRKPEIRQIKNRMATAVQARDLTWSAAEREMHQREFDIAMADLNRIMEI